jgi:exocyst complex component 2
MSVFITTTMRSPLNIPSTAQEPGHETLAAVLDLVKQLLEVFVNSLPLFWKVARGYMDGRLKKVI